jgi:hypothetical protein
MNQRRKKYRSQIEAGFDKKVWKVRRDMKAMQRLQNTETFVNEFHIEIEQNLTALSRAKKRRKLLQRYIDLAADKRFIEFQLRASLVRLTEICAKSALDARAASNARACLLLQREVPKPQFVKTT